MNVWWIKPSMNYNIDIIMYKLLVNLPNKTFSWDDKSEKTWKPCMFHVKCIKFYILFHLISCTFPCVHNPLLYEIDYSSGDQSSLSNICPDTVFTLALPLVTAGSMKISRKLCLCQSCPNSVKLFLEIYPARKHY